MAAKLGEMVGPKCWVLFSSSNMYSFTRLLTVGSSESVGETRMHSMQDITAEKEGVLISSPCWKAVI